MFQDLGGPIYAVILLIVVFMLYRAHRDPNNPLDLSDIIKENGKVSKIAIAFLVTLFTSSWYIVHEAIEKQLTDVAFAAYLATWAAPIIAHIIKGNGTPTAASPPSGPTT